MIPYDTKVLAFDLDGTLTQHKSPLSSEYKQLLTQLKTRYTLLMVGAGSCARIFSQMRRFPIEIIGNYGMQYARAKEMGDRIKLELCRDDRAEVDVPLAIRRADELRKKLGYTSFEGDTLEIHESGMLTFPILGTQAPIQDKLSYDPDRSKRRAVYTQVVEVFPEYKVYIGGSSSFDIVPHPYAKLYALDLYCAGFGLKHEEILYFGDDYGIGGNDEDVFLSDIPFQCIDDYRTIPRYLIPLLTDDRTGEEKRYELESIGK